VRVSLVVPILNEVENLPNLRAAISSIELGLREIGLDLEVILNDNLSNDGSSEVLASWASESSVFCHVQFGSRLTFQQSIINGFRTANGDCLVVFQGDLQDPWEQVIEFAQLWKSKGVKIVVGVATNRHSSLTASIGRRLFYKTLAFSSGVRDHRGFQDFYLLDRSVYKQLAKRKNLFQFVRGLIASEFKVEEFVPYQRSFRSKGKSKFPFAEKYDLALDALLGQSKSFTRFLSILGITSSIVSLIMLLLLFAASFLGASFAIQGWASLFFMLTLLLGILGFVSAIQFEYQRRILQILMHSD
jgi:dolichol-phosphate mannosyltransferase